MGARSRLAATPRWLVAALLVLSAWAITPRASAQTAEHADASSFFIVTRPDLRRCASPLCGGYFVKGVNQRLTRCADGALRTECHVLELDFTASGLSLEEAARFENEVFGAGQGLARGELEQRGAGAGVPADTLSVSEAWEGQAKSKPAGDFFGLSSTGILCATFPCAIHLGELLNSTRTRSFNAVELDGSGASADAVELGYDTLGFSGVLASGTAVRIVGPAGAGFDFVASELYLRLDALEECPKAHAECISSVGTRPGKTRAL